MAKKKLVFIVGDSIIQHVEGWDLSTNDRHVAVKSFSGARITDVRSKCNIFSIIRSRVICFSFAYAN